MEHLKAWEWFLLMGLPFVAGWFACLWYVGKELKSAPIDNQEIARRLLEGL